ncbi:FAD-dependent oxidoreductase [Campylobacterota bacterium]
MQSQYDVIILGAGINGLAIAKAMAEEGMKVLVIEKNHIAAGASSHSSRLIHGGLRYLEHYEFGLVKESLHDQQYLLDHYPDLVQLRSFYLPVYEGSERPLWLISLGLRLYTFLARHGEKATRIPIEEFLQKFRAIKSQGLKRVFRYYDAKTDDEALTRRVALEAEELGVDIREGTQLQSLFIEEEKISIEVDAQIHSTQLLINATGAWVDEVNTKFGLESSYRIEKLSGVHLVINRVLVPDPLILETSSKRVFFIIPEADTTLIGTTERSEVNEVDKIKVNNEDIEYLLYESNRYLNKELTRNDIKEVFIGTRPIIKSYKDPSKMSREYKLDLHKIGKNRVLHVYGGKLTTFASLARKVVRLIKK